MDYLYRGFMRLSGYAWAVALITGGVGFACFKLFYAPVKYHNEHKHNEHQDQHVHFLIC